MTGVFDYLGTPNISRNVDEDQLHGHWAEAVSALEDDLTLEKDGEQHDALFGFSYEAPDFSHTLSHLILRHANLRIGDVPVPRLFPHNGNAYAEAYVEAIEMYINAALRGDEAALYFNDFLDTVNQGIERHLPRETRQQTAAFLEAGKRNKPISSFEILKEAGFNSLLDTDEAVPNNSANKNGEVFRIVQGADLFDYTKSVFKCFEQVKELIETQLQGERVFERISSDTDQGYDEGIEFLKQQKTRDLFEVMPVFENGLSITPSVNA